MKLIILKSAKCPKSSYRARLTLLPLATVKHFAKHLTGEGFHTFEAFGILLKSDSFGANEMKTAVKADPSIESHLLDAKFEIKDGKARYQPDMFMIHFMIHIFNLMEDEIDSIEEEIESIKEEISEAESTEEKQHHRAQIKFHKKQMSTIKATCKAMLRQADKDGLLTEQDASELIAFDGLYELADKLVWGEDESEDDE